ncbi:pyocin knob domain-containing protein [Ignatzschineria rhizosphaerae]|uniref:Pyocin knob domain-containing protein n=1 Tax=Ignatzschineria rhizosphaerae TaxID=2923279 RepID=A0ABY3X2H3_9GAMM|nr:pyocin knob domain-containing protein [Ignatzschineria rhizosphaerae]UNM95657.1 pyocin knob domain-containing protein [Ignatzschineria rhizosphaerae]
MAYHVDNDTGVRVKPQKANIFSKAVLWFTDKIGTDPTIPQADWFNMIQGEVLGMAEALGITPDKLSDNQIGVALKKALDKIGTDITNLPKVLDSLGDSKKDAASQRIVNVVNKLAKDAMTAANNANDKANQAKQEAYEAKQLADSKMLPFNRYLRDEHINNANAEGRFSVASRSYITVANGYPAGLAESVVVDVFRYGTATLIQMIISPSEVYIRYYNLNNPSDVTWNKVGSKDFLSKGDYGIGGSGMHIGIDGVADDLDKVTIGGLYRVAANVLNRPPGAASGDSLIVLGWGGGYHSQMFFCNAAQKTYIRYSRNKVYSDWILQYDTSSATSSAKGFLRSSGSLEAVTTNELATVMSKSKTQAVTPFLLDAELTKRAQQDTRKRVDVTKDRVKDVEYTNTTDMPIEIDINVELTGINFESRFTFYVNGKPEKLNYLMSGSPMNYSTTQKYTKTVLPGEKYKYETTGGAKILVYEEFRK